jgi:5-methylcytosine-specific restriction protein A
MSKCSQYKKLINTARWRKLRLLKLQNSPVCEICERNGITTPAALVHHITPVEQGVTPTQMEILCYDFDNLQSLCCKCHVQAHIDLLSKSKANQKTNNKRKTVLFVERFLKE